MMVPTILTIYNDEKIPAERVTEAVDIRIVRLTMSEYETESATKIRGNSYIAVFLVDISMQDIQVFIEPFSTLRAAMIPYGALFNIIKTK